MLSYVNLWNYAKVLKFGQVMPKLWSFSELYQSYEILLKLC
jgi:hypothetical protein